MQKRLIKPILEWEKPIQVFREEMVDTQSILAGVGSLRENADVEAWLQRISQFENPATVPEGLGRLSKKSSIYLCRYFATKSHRNDPITL